jgi:hypothetical protein
LVDQFKDMAVLTKSGKCERSSTTGDLCKF